jgi:tetratricopeptide (TPR) repeat protein
VIAPGSVLDQRFLVERLAGSGGMGAVYEARDLRTGARVALKVILGAAGKDDALRFEREALALADLDHPGVVRYVAHAVTADRQAYLAMEWIDGEDLAARLARGPLSVKEALALGLAVAEALAAAHARGVVHRDLKPGNIVLPGGELARAKIVDFGLAVFPGAMRATVSGAAIGTPTYMAPEQARGAQPEKSADVFALACVLYECVAGRPAFAGQHLMAVLAKILLEEVPSLRELGCAVPEAFDALLARMLSKDPGARPADGAAALEALRLVAGASGITERASLPTSRELTRGEQRIFFIVLARGPDLEIDPRAPTVSEPVARPVAAIAAAIAAVEARGAQAFSLADGTLAVTVPAAGSAGDRAAIAAGCALAVAAKLAGWRVALATGRGEVGEGRPFGEAIERAAQRIKARAKAGGAPVIDVDDVTATLLDLRFEVAAGSLGLELRGERDVAEEARTLLGKPTPFVGRDRETATIEAVLAECVEESGARAVLVTAPAGTGKSRLRHEIVARTRRRGVAAWIARGDPTRAGAPFGLIAPLVRHAAQMLEGEPLDVRRQKLVARVARHVAPADRARIAEFLGELTGTPFPDEASVQLRAARRDPRLLGDQMRRAFLDFVDAETRAGPLAIVLEDMHWGDVTSAEYTDAALRLFAERPLFVMALARPEVHDRLPKLWHERAVQEIRLRELPRRACDRLAQEVLGGGATPEVLASLWERSAGNALMLEELVRATAEGRREVPETLLAIVESRLDALDPEDRRLLRAASVFGQVFWRGGLAALVGAEAPLEERLARLEQKEWITRRPVGGLGGEDEHAFRHALVRDAAYGTLTDEDRALGHRLAGAWLVGAGETNARVLADHFERGGEEAEAAGWYAAAAEQALEGNDLAGVIACAEKTVALGASGDALGRAALARASALNWRLEHLDAKHWAERALASLPEATAMWCAALEQRAWAAGAVGDFASVSAAYDLLVKSADRAESVGAWARAAASTASWLLFGARRDECRALEAMLGRLDSRIQGDPITSAVWVQHQAIRAIMSRDPVRARAATLKSLARFKEAGDTRWQCLQLSNIASISNTLGAYDEGESYARSALEAASRMGLSRVAAAAHNTLGLALVRRRRLGEAREILGASIEACRASGDQRFEIASRLYLVEALRSASALDEAEAEARRAVGVALDFPTSLAWARAELAATLLAQGRADGALELTTAARDLLAELADAMEEGESVILLVHAEALHATGNHEAARAAIADARDRLLAVAARIDDERLRASFLDAVSENARTLALAREWLGEAPLKA